MAANLLVPAQSSSSDGNCATLATPVRKCLVNSAHKAPRIGEEEFSDVSNSAQLSFWE